MDHTTLNRQIEQIRNLMANGKVEDAINELRTLSKTIRDSDTKDEIISISSKFNLLERDLRNQVVSANDLNLKRNQLTNQVLSLLSDLEASYERVTGNKPGGDATPSNQSAVTTTDKRPAWLIPVAIGLLLALLLGAWWTLGRTGEKVADTSCTEQIELARTAYFADDYTAASSLLNDLPPKCRNIQAAGQLKTKVDEAIARNVPASDNTNNTSSTPTVSEEEREEAEKKQKCNARYLEAVTYFQEKDYTKAKSAINDFTNRCGENERLQSILLLIEEATKPTPPESRTAKRFKLNFPEAYLVVSGSTIQLIAGNPMSYGQDWEVKKIKAFLYHVKHSKWKDFFWQVNTSREEVLLIRSGTFGKMGGTTSKEKMRVVSYPNKSTPTRFQLYFDDCYLIHSPPSTVQVVGAGKVLQREDVWDVRKISPTVYHLKNKAWRTNLFWKADLAAEKLTKFRGTSEFGKSGADSAELVDADLEITY